METTTENDGIHRRPRDPDFGTGIYSFPQAARLISRGEWHVSPQTLRYWIATGLTPASYGRAPSGSLVLSFLDLISLEIVRRFREAGVSLQRVRKLEVLLRSKYPHIDRPFAHKIFFTDGVSVWHQLHPADGLVEILGKHPDQVSWKPAIQTFAQEVRYEHGTATVWRPAPSIEINPRIQFGAPVVTGTRIPVSTIAADLKAASPEEVAGWHGIRVSEVQGVREYLRAA